MSAFSLLISPGLVTKNLPRLTERPATDTSKKQAAFDGLVASVNHLSPDTFSVQWIPTSELLRFLQRMAASKPTSWLSELDHFLFH
jgi:hypothetical protein